MHDTGTKTLLLVDDDSPFTMSLADGLRSSCPGFTVLTAENGEQALDVLASGPVDLVVTDLNMPVMDGFQLVSRMSSRHPLIPVIVLTAFGAPEIENSLSSFSIPCIDKPIDLGILTETIRSRLDEVPGGCSRNVTLPAFLQLVASEKKTCTVRVSSGEKKGTLWFRDGELMQAETTQFAGTRAAHEMLRWNHPSMETLAFCQVAERRVDAPLEQVLSEFFRLRDPETRETEEEPVYPLDAPGANDTPPREIRGGDTIILVGQKLVTALEQHLLALTEIRGFRAAGVMSCTGEMLAATSRDPELDLRLVGSTFNGILRSAHEASRRIGLDACRGTEINTPRGIIVLRCSGVDAPVHFHLLGFIAEGGNQSLMKMLIDKMVAPIMEELQGAVMRREYGDGPGRRGDVPRFSIGRLGFLFP